MFDSRAAQLQKQALDALSDLRTWIWGRHGAMLPDDLASITREEAERYAAYLDWYSRVEEVLLALTASGVLPTAVQPPADQPAPLPVARQELLDAPTVRAPSSYGRAEHATGWQRVISVLSNLDGSAATPDFKAA